MTPQRTATHCNTLQHMAAHYSTLQHTATQCNTLQHTALGTCVAMASSDDAATHCNTLQHSATLCNTLQHTATHCNTPQHTATHCNTLHLALALQWHLLMTLPHTATLCNNTLQYTATTLCNTLPWVFLPLTILPISTSRCPKDTEYFGNWEVEMNDEEKLGTRVCEFLQYPRTKQSNTWLLRKEDLPEGQGPATKHWPFFAFVSYSI